MALAVRSRPAPPQSIEETRSQRDRKTQNDRQAAVLPLKRQVQYYMVCYMTRPARQYWRRWLAFIRCRLIRHEVQIEAGLKLIYMACILVLLRCWF